MGELRFVLAVGALLAAFYGGWQVNGWRLTAEHTAKDLERSKATVRWMETADAERVDLAARLAASNDAHLKKLRKAKNETNRLRACLADGTCGLRLVAEIPRSCPGVPEAGASPGVDSGARPGPPKAAGGSYPALLDGINLASAQLAACQDQLKIRTGASTR